MALLESADLVLAKGQTEGIHPLPLEEGDFSLNDVKGTQQEGGNKMPDFVNAFSGMHTERKLTPEELVRAIRFMVAAEYEAVQVYTQLAESIDNKLAAQVLREIADEELVHAGEFLRLVKELAPNEEQFYQQGAQEVEEKIGK